MTPDYLRYRLTEEERSRAVQSRAILVHPPIKRSYKTKKSEVIEKAVQEVLTAIREGRLERGMYTRIAEKHGVHVSTLHYKVQCHS